MSKKRLRLLTLGDNKT